MPDGPSAVPHAALWAGSAASFVDMHPPSMGFSYVYAMAPGVQVGEAFDGLDHRASVWRGSSGSWTDLTPPGVGGIWQLYGTTGTVHVGAGASAGGVHAMVCFGTAGAWLDLHQYLPPGYSGWSVARAVCQDGDTLYVGGWAVSDASGQDEAFLWTGLLPCYVNCDGSSAVPTLNVSDFTCFLQRFATGNGYANCDRSTTAPALNVADFTCFLQRFAAGCP